MYVNMYLRLLFDSLKPLVYEESIGVPFLDRHLANAGPLLFKSLLGQMFPRVQDDHRNAFSMTSMQVVITVIVARRY